MPDTTLSHLHALEEGLSHERARLAAATTEQERALRQVWIGQREREIAGERAFLGLPSAPATADISDDDLLAALND